MGTNYMGDMFATETDRLLAERIQEITKPVTKEQAMQVLQAIHSSEEAKRFLGIVTYVHKENATEEETFALAKMGRTLDSLRGATIITHPMAWITDQYGIQGQGTASLVFGTSGHRQILKEVMHEIEATSVHTITFNQA